MDSLPSGTHRSLADYDDSWWDHTIDQLTKYAHTKIKRRTWLGIRGGVPLAGTEASDVVHLVLAKVFSGAQDPAPGKDKRHWDPDATPDLFTFLSAQVDSEISNLVTKEQNKKTTRISSAGESPEMGQYPAGKLYDVRFGPEATALERDWQTRFSESLNDERDLQDVVEAALLGLSRKEIAEFLNLERSELDNRRKRLKRRWVEFNDRACLDVVPQKGGLGRA